MCSGHSTIDVNQPGTVSSSGFQKNIPYPNNQDCVLYLRIPWKKVLSIQFLDFNLEESENCQFDRLEILESKNSRDYSFNKTLCGSKRPENLLIEGPIIKFHFVSDKYRQFSGFKFAYQLANQTGEIKQIDQSCPKQLIIDVQSSGSITSPGFERGEYPPDKKCEYILRFPADKRLKINFDVFSLEDECDYDSVTIFNPKTRNELGRFCGNNIPKDMSLSGPEVGVRFESDRFNQRRGFRLFYSLHTIECGVRDWSEDAQIEATVIQGGKVESIRKWPWMVSIRKGGFKYKHYCGGVIIDENWILSAKHCFKGVSSNTPDTDVLTGSLSSIDYYRQAVPVERIEYPGSSIEYQGPVMRFKDDIALLKLKQPLKMSEKRKPICIEKTDRKSYKQCFLAGWGKYLPNSNNADYLQEVKIPILSDGDCSYRFGTRYYHPPSMVCAGGNGWACKGDSGGPLMCYDESSLKWSVVGIVSFGFDCATFPYDAYSKVSYFAKWIQETMSKDKRNSTKEHRKAPSIVATSVKEDHEGPNIVGLSNTDSIMCLGHSTIDVTQPGTVSSPGFQKNIPYPNNQDCVLYLRIPWKKVLSIQFLDFNLEESENCKFDRLEILESKNSRDYSFNKTLCGSKRPENLLIEGPIIKFHFVSDKYRQFSGFKFAYQLATQKGEINQIDQSCPKQLIIDVRSSGNITSPGFERGEYPPNKKCEYILRFPADKRLKINFDVFSLEDECDYDSVTIFNPKTRNELGRFCGNNIPKDMSLSGPEVGVRFESDRFNQRRGFRLFYSLHTIECGVRDWTEDAQIEATVIQGGKVESIRKWPWMVSIRKGGFKYEHYCGGVIIDENWILSAKHCFRGASSNTPNIDVLTGSLGRIDYYRQAVPVERIEYPGSLMDLRDDIALLKLKQPLKMSEKRKPICIEKTDRKSFKQCFLAGWGRYLPNSNNADYLQEVKIPILSDEDCSYMFGTTDYHPPSMVCAGGNGWACKADSGGPLMCYDESSLTWSVVGIVSFGGDCATFPYDAYSKVSYFAKWIQETMSKDKRNSTKEGRKAPSIVANSVKEDHEGPNIVGLSNTDSIMCSGHSTIDVTQPGTVSSSGFQKNIPYPNNQDCVLYLRIPWKKVLSIQFLDFNLEESEKCQFDRLEILESKNSRDYSFNKTLCGSKRPENLLIEGPIIKFHFVSDKYRQFSGFKFAYQLATQKGEINQIDQSCPKQLIIDVRSSGNITSPGFERGEYPPNKKCEYILRFPAEKRLKINFDVFSLEDECDYDSVTIFNPKTRNELGRFCGNNIPKDMSLSGPEVGVRFESDRFNQRRGFRLFYSLHTIECGVREWTEDAQIEATVIQGGKVESIRKWPWMVSIRKGGFKYEHYCGGVIIDENWILSAKHCFRGASSNTPNIDVLTGSLGRIDYYRQAVPVERIEYPGSLMDLRDDIALLKLKQPLKMSEKRKPICIEKTDRKSFKQCFLAGWGKYLPNSNNAEYLQEVKIPILSDGDCSYRFGTRYYHPPSMVCAGGNGWACKADSGGPLMCYDESSLTWSVVGIVSFGGDCATFPYDAYSKVSYFAKWIQETMSKDKRNSTKEDRKAPSIVANSVKEDHEGPNIVGLSNTDSIMCSGHSTIDVTQPGTVSSPGFQKNIPYPNNQDCVLYLRIPWKKVLSIQFLDFNLEESENCQFDRLEILESKNSRDYSFNKTLCGSKRPENLLIEGPIIKFHFVSDKYRQFSGFKFAYQLATQKGEINQIDQSCPKQLIIDVRSSGNITSPGFERGEYPPNKNCEYILRFPTDVRLKINFDVFSLEDECDYDSVTIFNPKTRNELGRFCGNNIPKDMSLSGPEVGVRFESDRFNQRRGFRLFYSLHTIECGVRDWTEDAQIEATVIQGGKVESIRKWPWMVSIRERFVIHQHGCGGVIIDENWILSAKHCLEGVSTNTPNIFVLTGSLSSIDYYNQTVPVERIEYPGSSIEYQGPMTRFKDDIALLKLKQPLKMSEKRKPICIEKTDRKSFKQCFLAGWGQYPPNYNYAEDLREVKIPILSDEDCSYMFGTRYYHPPSMVCAGGNGWACYGDSGGPLMCYDESSLTWSVVGIASFGTGCESLRYNGYTKVSYFAKWIQETMSKDKRNSTKEDRKAPSIVATSVKEDHEATNIVGLSNTDSIMCSGHSTIDVTQPGTVSSSGFQKNIPYPNNQDCVLYLRIPWKKVLSIQFLDFNLEESEKCQFDRLEILESKNSRDYSFNKTLCGSKRPENLLIEGPIIKFHFVSDKYRQFSGFKFAYQLATQKGEINQIDQSCPKQLIIDVRSSGNITSPGFERGEYPPNKKCEYILRFPTDLRLKINFDVFSLEDECDYDAVTIFDPRNQYEIARFCGNNIPKDMILRGPAIGIRFESDEHVQFRGFRLFYSFHMIDEIKQIDQSCPKQLIIDVQSSGSITSPGFERGEYPPDKKCEYILRFPADKRLKINFDVFSLEDECDYDSVTIFNPKTRNELGRFCGNNIPKDMSLTGPEVGVRFESDNFNQRRGFRLFYSLHTIECGVRDWTEDAQIEATIIKGRRVESIRKWPWMVSLHRKEDGYVCGGMIINEHWVLTAAHCVTRSLRNRLTLYVQAGTLERESDSQLIPVERVDCLHNNIIYRDDVALVKLKEPLKMSENIAPICITKTDQKSFKRCVVTGWGTFSRYSGFNRFLHEAEVQIESDQFCASSFQIYNYHPPSMVCAGGNESACYGDSGGPLMCYDESSLRWTAVGIVSFGKKCGEILYGAYQKVSYFANWIEQMISKDENKGVLDGRFDFVKSHQQSTPQSHCWKFGDFFLYQGDDSEMEIEKPRRFCHELWSYENDYTDISKNGCNFDDSNLCNYYILENSNWKIQKNPQNSSDRYLVIYNKMKRPYQEVELWPPSFFFKSARCLSFKYKIEPVIGSLLSIIGEEIDISQDTIRKKSVWTSDSTAGWNKAQIVLSDSNFENFYFSMSIQAMASVAIDDISVNRWC